MLTDANSSVYGVAEYGLAEENSGSLVVYDASNPFDALRTRAPRTLVVKQGQEIARTESSKTRIAARTRVRIRLSTSTADYDDFYQCCIRTVPRTCSVRSVSVAGVRNRSTVLH